MCLEGTHLYISVYRLLLKTLEASRKYSPLLFPRSDQILKSFPFRPIRCVRKSFPGALPLSVHKSCMNSPKTSLTSLYPIFSRTARYTSTLFLCCPKQVRIPSGIYLIHRQNPRQEDSRLISLKSSLAPKSSYCLDRRHAEQSFEAL